MLRIVRSRLGIKVFPAIRIRISPTRFRVADVAVWRDGNIGDRITTVPPFLVIEVLPPEDRMTRMQPKIAECLSIGVCYSQQNPAGVLSEVLRTENPAIEIPLAAALDLNA